MTVSLKSGMRTGALAFMDGDSVERTEVPVCTVPVVGVRLVRESSVAAPQQFVSSPHDAAVIFQEMLGDRDREAFASLMLNMRHRVLAAHIVSVGSLDSAPAGPREVFRAAILAGAGAIVVGHNHPSGSRVPSRADLAITARLVRAGQILHVKVLDHIIVTCDGGWVSLRERGVVFDPGKMQRDDN